mmetsp:Transcript_45416/g.125270  ORF Transcript_45416/g.125270 Transcript_45416/m.125270 type:complete len:265 (+) Transcript_45416:617-1411(+)
MFVATGVVAGVCAWIYTSLFLLTGHRQGMYWRKMYLEAVLRQDVAWFDVHNPTELPTKIAEKTAAVQQGLGLKLGEGIFFGVQMFGGVGYAFWMDWKVSLVSLITAPLVGWGLYFLTKVTGEADAIMNKAYAKAGGCASETIENIKTVNALQCEDARIEEYDTHLVEVSHTAGHTAPHRTTPQPRHPRPRHRTITLHCPSDPLSCSKPHYPGARCGRGPLEAHRVRKRSCLLDRQLHDGLHPPVRLLLQRHEDPRGRAAPNVRR